MNKKAIFIFLREYALSLASVRDFFDPVQGMNSTGMASIAKYRMLDYQFFETQMDWSVQKRDE